jgi:ketosteroid isomerase-like protein
VTPPNDRAIVMDGSAMRRGKTSGPMMMSFVPSPILRGFAALALTLSLLQLGGGCAARQPAATADSAADGGQVARPSSEPVRREDGGSEAAVRALLVEQQEAWNRGDLDSFMSGYWNSPELVFTSGGQVQRGFRTVLERYRQTYGTDRAAMGRLAFSDLEVYGLGTSAAWALGRWTLELEDRRLGGIFTLVLQRFPEGWRIVHDHTSSGKEPAAESPPPPEEQSGSSQGRGRETGAQDRGE